MPSPLAARVAPQGFPTPADWLVTGPETDTLFTVVDLEPGTDRWCARGNSKTQPYCDDSHAGTEWKPVELSVEKKRRLKLCLCKHTRTPPCCDSSHNRL